MGVIKTKLAKVYFIFINTNKFINLRKRVNNREIVKNYISVTRKPRIISVSPENHVFPYK
jgi:guanylate kinase